MEINREAISRQLRDGRTPDQICKGDTKVFRAALEEQARLADELDAFAPTAANVVDLRDQRRLRWEAISARVFGNANQANAVRALYDEIKGPGSAKRSWTGRGRRFPGMEESPPQATNTDVRPAVGPTAESPFYGIGPEREASPQRLNEADVLRTGSIDDVRAYLVRYLHSDRFYLDAGRIWLELPNRADSPATMVQRAWFVIPQSYAVRAPSAGTRAGNHAVPEGWDATLCRIPLGSWTSGATTPRHTAVSCRWCQIRLLAIDIASNESPTR
jgi:hypothetical protein